MYNLVSRILHFLSRLVLPYVRHLKGEDDKPLPPVKPRKQYKVSKEPKADKGTGAVEKKRSKKEKSRDQVRQCSAACLEISLHKPQVLLHS